VSEVRHRVGTWHERASRELQRCPSYYAADWEKLQTIAGDYDATVMWVGGYTVPMPQWLLVSVPSTRLDGALYSGFGGLNFASTPLEKGERVNYHIQAGAYQIKECVAEGLLTLEPRWAFLTNERAWEGGPRDWAELAALAKGVQA
jgi:hypothetical protein